MDATSPEKAATSPDNTLVLIASNAVLFPGVVMPLAPGQPAAAAALQEAARNERHIAVVLQRDPTVQSPGLADLYSDRHGGTPVALRHDPRRRASRHRSGHRSGPAGDARRRAAPIRSSRSSASPSRAAEGTEIAARVHQLRERALETLRLIEQAPPELVATIQNLQEPGMLADLVTSLLDLSPAEKQSILETVDLRERLDRVLWRLAYRLEVLRLSADIGNRTRQTMEGRQREFMLREQLKQIQKELGEDDAGSPELADLRRALENAGLPEEADRQAKRELRRLERMPEGGPESGMVRSYLEWLSELPWKLDEEKPIDLVAARRVLDEDHFDLEKIKRRIIEFLAVRKLNPAGRGPILCFVGSARRRQDLARPVDRARHGPALRAREPRRGA